MSDRPFIVGFGFGVLPVILAFYNGWIWFPSVLRLEDYCLMCTAVIITFVNYLNEYQQYFPLQYSKFAPEGGVPARAGWFTLYFLPMLSYVLVWYYLGAPDSQYDLLMLGMYCLHFSKRCFETIFIHKYSKDCLFETVIEISLLYSLGAVVAAYSIHQLTGSSRYNFLDDELRVKVGLVIFGLGQFVNLLHHYKLANLRTPGSFKYVIPTGGLFGLVVCPQYFGELLSWLGFALTSFTYGGFLNYMPMVAYLSARAHHTHRWYKNKFDDYPGKGTKKLWPFVY